MRQIKQLDFTGEKVFVGIDVHKKPWPTGQFNHNEHKEKTQRTQ
jgi:hypothetical protein